MANTQIEIDETAFVRSLEDYEARIKPKLQQALEKCVFSVEADAKVNCPVDTGRLRMSITSDVGDLEGSVGTNVDYAPYVEYGTYKQAPRPYLRPAFDKNIATLESDLKKILGGK